MTKAHSAADKTALGNATSLKPLARVLIDALIEQDLLGVLFSGYHLRLALCELDLHPHQTTAAVVASDPVVSAVFHKQTLQMFTGIYIEECLHDSRQALMIDLDHKCQNWLNSTRRPPSMNPALEHQLELHRQYRKHCARAIGKTRLPHTL
jgi:hypothetical protein